MAFGSLTLLEVRNVNDAKERIQEVGVFQSSVAFMSHADVPPASIHLQATLIR